MYVVDYNAPQDTLLQTPQAVTIIWLFLTSHMAILSSICEPKNYQQKTITSFH